MSAGEHIKDTQKGITMKAINISNNIIDSKAMSRLMKIEDGNSNELYIVRSKSDCMNDLHYTVLTSADDSESSKLITTPIMVLSGNGKVEQMYRGMWIGDTTVDRMDYLDVTWFHPTSVRDFFELLSRVAWFEDIYNWSSASEDFDADYDNVDNDVIVKVKVNRRDIKEVTYVLKYESDIAMYKVYVASKIDF